MLKADAETPIREKLGWQVELVVLVVLFGEMPTVELGGMVVVGKLKVIDIAVKFDDVMVVIVSIEAAVVFRIIVGELVLVTIDVVFPYLGPASVSVEFVVVVGAGEAEVESSLVD